MKPTNNQRGLFDPRPPDLVLKPEPAITRRPPEPPPEIDAIELPIEPNRARLTDPETSHDAAASFDPSAICRRMSDLLEGYPEGLTTTEMARLLEIQLVSVSPLPSKMVRSGTLCNSGKTRVPEGKRCKSILWVLPKFLPEQEQET
jgi:hypothetical protein